MEDGRAVLRVWDNGPGVPEDLLQRLTDPFFRTDKARTHTADGSGIGLTIVARSVALMQGTLQIENVVPNGLSFTMTFPLDKEE
jgi:signal transduction histidine kinase